MDVQAFIRDSGAENILKDLQQLIAKKNQIPGISLSLMYRSISNKLDKNEFNINEAKHELILNNEKLIISGKTRRIEQ